MTKKIMFEQNCNTKYPNCGSPHACDLCHQLRDAEDDIQELIKKWNVEIVEADTHD